jgi:hypothetical protein
MKTYSEIQMVPEEDVRAWEQATAIVSGLPTFDHGGAWLRCHEIARLVGRRLGLGVEDGFYEIAMEHSWLRTRGGHVLDVYAPARIPPVVLVVAARLMPSRYRAADIGLVVRADVLDWLEARVPFTPGEGPEASRPRAAAARLPDWARP